VEIATIGFTRSTARSFFERLREAGLPTLVDVRLNNTSQLAGWAKREDLPFFLDQLCGMAYVHEPLLAPEESLLNAYRKEHLPFAQYEPIYEDLIRGRQVEEMLDRALFERGAVLLCSEATPEHCHRRLAAEYLARAWPDVTITHL
jgi:uncharacterized protein (DUF488 family)